MPLLTSSLASAFVAAFAAASALVCLGGPVQAQTAAFTFDTLPVYLAHSPLTMTQNGITATFTNEFGPQHPGGGPYDDGQFFVAPKDAPGHYGNYYSSAFSGNVFISEVNHSVPYQPLVILFSRPVSAVSFDFALPDFPVGALPITFSTFRDDNCVGTQSVTATAFSDGWFPEGVAHYSSKQMFNKIVLDVNPAQFMIVDNVEVTAPVPEASSLVSLGVLLALGMGGLAISVRRRAHSAV